MFGHILVAFDGSADSTAGFHFALRLAELDGGRITLVNVVPSLVEEGGRDHAREAQPELAEWIQRGREGWEERLEALAVAAPAAVAVETKAILGSPASTLLELIAKVRPDLAIAGTHGVGLRRYLLGSVSQRLLEGATCDLLLVREDTAAVDPSSVIVGIDESENARRALQRGQALASLFSACLVLVHVSDYRVPFAHLASYPSAKRLIDEHGRKLLADAHSSVTAPLECVREEREGPPHEGLAAVCRERQPAIAVVGCRGSHAALIGGTARELVNDAPCSVLAVRGSPDPSE